MEHDSAEDSFLTVADVAEMLKLNQQTVRNWIDQGSLPALKVGRRVRIRRSDLDLVLEQGRTTSVAAPRTSGPNAQDFWSGAAVGVADVDPDADPGPEATETVPVAGSLSEFAADRTVPQPDQDGRGHSSPNGRVHGSSDVAVEDQP